MLKKHGITLGIERVGEEIFLSIKAIGKLTDKDYKTITPLIDKMLEGIEQPKVKVLMDVRKFEGWEPKAAWDDFTLGLKYGNSFDKIALVGASNLLAFGAKIAGWFMTGGEVENFDTIDEALKWISN